MLPLLQVRFNSAQNIKRQTRFVPAASLRQSASGSLNRGFYPPRVEVVSQKDRGNPRLTSVSFMQPMACAPVAVVVVNQQQVILRFFQLSASFVPAADAVDLEPVRSGAQNQIAQSREVRFALAR